MKKSLLFVMICLVMILGACSQKPKDVSQEFWDDAIQVTLYIDDAYQNNELTDSGITGSLSKDLKSLSDKEREINTAVLDLSLKSIMHSIALIGDKSVEESEKSYQEAYTELEKIFGKSNLKKSNFNKSKIEGELAENREVKKQENDELKQQLMSKYDAVMTANEVQYDLSNNLGTPFYLEGSVELCDYYNYGYTNEEKFFCSKVTPIDGDYSDSWYIYFHRESFNKVYANLLENKYIDLRMIAEIPRNSYKRGQGNMAIAKASSHY